MKTKFEIAKLELKPGDILVIRTLEHYPSAFLEEIINNFKKIVPDGIKGIVLDKGIELSVVHPEVKT